MWISGGAELQVRFARDPGEEHAFIRGETIRKRRPLACNHVERSVVIAATKRHESSRECGERTWITTTLELVQLSGEPDLTKMTVVRAKGVEETRLLRTERLMATRERATRLLHATERRPIDGCMGMHQRPRTARRKRGDHGR